MTNKYGWSGTPMLPPDSLIHIIWDINEKTREAVKTRLAVASRDQVLLVYRDAVRKRNRGAVWMFGEELCRRHIPPAFRHSVFVDEKPLIPLEDVFLLDLQWLGSRYPDQRPFFKSLRGLFEPKHFLTTAARVMNRGLHKPAYYIRALALTDDQQIESVYIHGAPVRRRLQVIAGLSTDARETLKAAHMARPKARAQGNAKATFDRRFIVWRCGSLADWAPQRTAELYEALTGTEMSRQLAGKIIEEVWRDFPPSRPVEKQTRRRRRSTR